jgi:hypothetical protein
MSRLIIAILALLPTLILGAVFGVESVRDCSVNPSEVVALTVTPAHACCCCEPGDTPEPQQSGPSACCCAEPSPLNSILLCCLAPLGPVVPTSQAPLNLPTDTDFVLPVWEIQPHGARAYFATEELATVRAGPPPLRSSLCVWVI